jgi:ABC-type branched-subunit amino acid transport system ATPase component
VSLEVRRGEVLALLGTNGAGKSTLLRVLSGLGRPSRGRVLLDGEDVTDLAAEARVERGIVLVSGGKATFPGLTVAEHLRVGAFPCRRDRAVVAERRDEVLDRFPKLRLRLDQRAGSMSGGEQQMLALAKGLLLRPSLLCIDELSLGLAPLVVGELLEVVEQLAASGTTFVIVEQSVNVALSIAERAVFMEKGTCRFEGPAAELRAREDLLRAVFLGDG